MRDLTKRGIIAAPPADPKGIAFEIADLIHIKGWADFHNLGWWFASITARKARNTRR
jgi:hypothetical protein